VHTRGINGPLSICFTFVTRLYLAGMGYNKILRDDMHTGYAILDELAFEMIEKLF